MSKSKYGYLAKNTLLFTISSFGSKILTFLLVPLYTNVLSTADYGTADLISTTASLLLFAVTLNIADSVLRFAIERESNQDEILGYGIKVIAKGNFLFLILLCIFAYLNPIKWDRTLYIFLFLNVVVSSFYNVVSNYLRAIDKIKETAIAGIISTIVIISSNIITLLVLKTGLHGYLISTLLGPLISTVYCMFNCDGFFLAIKNATKDKSVQRAMVAYSLPLIFNGIAWWINASIDKYFIVAMLGTSENGVYAVAQKIPTILTTFATVFMQAWNLSAIKEFDKEDKDGFFANTYKTINSGLVIICSGIILFNVLLAKFLYAKDFFIAWKCSSWLAVSVVFSSMSGFEGSIFAAVKDSKIFSVSTIISALINMALNTLLIPFIGVQGAAIATVVSFFLVWLIRYVCTRKYIKLRINIWRDLIVYGFLILQVLLEQLEGHCYLGQIIILVAIVLIYRDNIKNIVQVILNKVKHEDNI